MRILVLAGGPSSEREISLEGGRAVADACRRLGHEVAVADFLPDNHAALDLPCDVVFPVLHGPYGEDGTLQAILDERGLFYVGSGAAASRLCMDKHAAKSRWRDAGLPTAAWAVVERERWLPCFQDRDQGAGITLAGNAVEPPVVVKPVGEGSSV
ncbi:MAG: hypothetical protein JW719_08930, partial [Pirellulales bacterium]|nr:hypothetical protein [Pirellulales bacterium]